MERSTMGTDVWEFRDTRLGHDVERIVGYDVEAIDGSIGKVDDATFDAGGGQVVVDTGPWIFGRKVMLPAGVVRGVDHDRELVYVHRTKDEIKNAPEFDDSLREDDTFRERLGSYYGSGGQGWRSDWPE